jgi:hypothetical protein
VGSSLDVIGEYARVSAAAGGFDRADARLRRAVMRLDARGFTQLSKAVDKLLDQAEKIEASAAERIARESKREGVVEAGVGVMLFEALDRVLPTEDADISKVAGRALAKQNMTIHTGTLVENVQSSDDKVSFSFGDENAEVDWFVIAAGRGPDIEGFLRFVADQEAAGAREGGPTPGDDSRPVRGGEQVHDGGVIDFGPDGSLYVLEGVDETTGTVGVFRSPAGHPNGDDRTGGQPDRTERR